MKRALAPLFLALPLGAQLPGPEPADPDADRDGLSDFQERHKYGTDPAKADSDGDGTPDGDWDERREYAYSVRTVVRVVKPVDVAAANDDYQDARLVDEGDDWAELEVIHYPLGTAAADAGALAPNPDWRDEAARFDAYLESTTTSNFDAEMRDELFAELRAEGLGDAADDRELAVAAARRLMARSEFEDGFTTFLADFKRGRAVVPKDLKKAARKEEAENGRSLDEQWERELFARGMFEHGVHGSCTSSAIYLTGGLRAVGVPTRIVLLIPLVDANDPAQIEMVRSGIRHHQVRVTTLRGLAGARGWASHTFNEVLVGGRWRRLNYTRLGQPILDQHLFGMTTHVLTVRDWADARMGRTVGRRQFLGLRDDVLRTSNPYAALEVSDRFGVHADIPNPPVEEPEPLSEVRIRKAFWLASDDRPEHLNVSRVDLATDRLHVVLAAAAEELTLERSILDPFWDEVPKAFELLPAGSKGDGVPATAVRGTWWGRVGDEPYLYFLLRLAPAARERLVAGATYRIVPAPAAGGRRFTMDGGVELRIPR
ncbi:MAG: transglutaminase domain-containing protein [Planctomycetota bacterium]